MTSQAVSKKGRVKLKSLKKDCCAGKGTERGGREELCGVSKGKKGEPDPPKARLRKKKGYIFTTKRVKKL